MAFLPLSHEPIDKSEHVRLNGVHLEQGKDWRLYRNAAGVLHVQTLTAAEVKAGDELDCYYAWSDAMRTDDKVATSPYGPNSPASGPNVGPQFDEPSEWPYYCSGSNRYWTPTGYVPQGYGTLTEGPGNTLQQPRLNETWTMRLEASGFGTGTATWRWYNPTATGAQDNFGTVRMFFLKPDGCIWDASVYYAQNYADANFSVTGTVTAGGLIEGGTSNGQSGPPAGSIFIRAIRNYQAMASWFITHDIGYNPAL